MTQRPLFCDLLAHVSLALEREVPEETVHVSKTTLLDHVERLCAALTSATGLTPDGAIDFVAAVTAMTGNFWQISHPPRR